MKDRKITRKIMKDRKYPGPEQIRKYQDFDRLVQNHALIKKVLMKKLMIWGGSVIGLSAIATLVILNLNNNAPQIAENKQNPVNEPVKVTCVQPPIPGKEQPYSIYRISAKEGGEINYATGSRIVIPAHAFKKQNGSEPADSVTVNYREFHDVLDIFLSGIPMEYDSAGVKRNFESAGMLEILAFDGDEALKLNEQTPIQVNLASNSADEKYKVYELDQALSNWLDHGKDVVQKMEEPKVEKRATVRKPEEVKETVREDELLKPEKADPNKYNFTIKDLKKVFPELTAYENIKWEVTDNQFDKKYYTINWDWAKVVDGKTPRTFIVRAHKGDTTLTFNVKPVFEGADYEAALQKFEERHHAALKERDKKEFEKQQTINKVNKELSTYRTDQLLATAGRMMALNNMRTFSIRRLGIHNIDYPLSPIESYALNVKRYNESEKVSNGQISFSTIFLAEKGKNAVFTFTKDEPVKCDPKAKNLMWTVTDKNEIAFFRISDYTKLQRGTDNDLRPELPKSQDLAFEEIRKFSSEK